MGSNNVRKRKRRKENIKIGNNKIQAVIFVQHTEFSKMAKRMREKLDKLEKLGSIKIKLVERAGDKLVDVLHKSNAWSEADCEREDCLICSTEGSRKGSCRRRNVLYETFCKLCPKDGANIANDTPVLVEAEAKSIREKNMKLPNLMEGIIEENIDSNEKLSSVVEDTEEIVSPGIYKKGGHKNLQSTGFKTTTTNNGTKEHQSLRFKNNSHLQEKLPNLDEGKIEGEIEAVVKESGEKEKVTSDIYKKE